MLKRGISMELYLLRHAIAAERGPGYPRDSARPLTERGQRRMRRAARGMVALGLEFDAILTSPYARARRTAELVADALDARDILEETPALAADGDPRALVEALAPAADERVLLVGHEPYLSELVSALISGGAGTTGVRFKKGGLCKLQVDTLRYDRCARLEWLLAPRHLRRLGA